jgi:hypothetical protein
MDPRKNLKKILVILGIILIGLAVLCYFEFIDIKNKNENISYLDNQLSSQANKQELASSMDLIIKNSQPSIDLVDSSIVSSDGDVTFIESLESLAKTDGLNIGIDSLVITDDKSLTSNNMSFFNIKANTSGSWSGTYLFLAQLESLPIKLKVNKFSFTNATNDLSKISSKGNTWDGSFEITVLKYK